MTRTLVLQKPVWTAPPATPSSLQKILYITYFDPNSSSLQALPSELSGVDISQRKEHNRKQNQPRSKLVFQTVCRIDLSEVIFYDHFRIGKVNIVETLTKRTIVFDILPNNGIFKVYHEQYSPALTRLLSSFDFKCKYLENGFLIISPISASHTNLSRVILGESVELCS